MSGTNCPVHGIVLTFRGTGCPMCIDIANAAEREGRSPAVAIPGVVERTIARALEAFSGEDEAALCAFLQSVESNRLHGDSLQGWRVTRDAVGWVLECMTVDGQHVFARSTKSCKEACSAISARLIALAMKGAPEA